MGFRTVVILSNDLSTQWQDDPELGRKILTGVWRDERFPYGQVVEQAHCDTVSLMVVDSLQGKVIAGTCWNSKDKGVELLRQAADKLGYRLSRKPALGG